MVYRYPPEVHELVKEWCMKLRDYELAAYCNEQLGTNFTPRTMKSFRGNHGYKNHKTQYTTEEYWRYQTRWPQGMFEYIRDNSWNVSSAEMAERVNERFGTNWTAHRMKVFRAKHHIRTGNAGWYQKGREPGNKGRRQSEYCSPEALERSRATQFSKGHKPANEMPVGTVVRNKYGYLMRKVSMTGSQWERWEFLHRAVWEEHNGPVPEGMVVTFKDGDKGNCSIENLILMTKGERCTMTRWGYQSGDPELTEVGLAVVRLKQARKRRSKK